MRIGVITSWKSREGGRKIAEYLQSLNLSVSGFTADEDGKPRSRLGAERLVERLRACDVAVFVPSDENGIPPFFLFACGLILGRRRKGYVYLPNGGSIPDCFPGFTAVSTLSELGASVKHDSFDWHARREVRNARKAIIDAELCLSRESFAACVAEGDIRSACNFLKAGFSVHTRDRKGVPVLCIAVRNKHRAMVNMLLERGADVNIVSVDRQNTALMDAASGGDAEILSDLISHGADLNIRSRNGQTALMLAIGNGATVAARLLIEAGADTKITDNLGMTAGKYAELFRNTDIVAVLDSRDNSRAPQPPA